MSVPLDRLYDFLQTVCNHDVLIYRYYPHGSRKIDDCTPLTTIHKSLDANELCVVCHDQEPLDYREFEPYLPFKIEHRNLLPILQCITYHSGLQYDKILLCHSELRSKDLEWFEQHDSIGVYYWSHALIARDWYRYAQYDSRLIKNKIYNKDFLIYNRAWRGLREYRIKFTELLVHANLQTACKITFNPMDGQHHYKDHQFTNLAFEPQRCDLEKFLQPTLAPAASSADYDANDYCQHRIEVVLETVFDDIKWHLTEKTLRPIACGTPFIIVSTPGVLQYLRSYGFKTYESVWDESYDSILDPVKRMQAVIDLMHSIASMNPSDKQLLMDRCAEISKFNQQLFFSDDFWKNIVSEFTRNLDCAVDEMNLHTGRVRQYVELHYQ